MDRTGRVGSRGAKGFLGALRETWRVVSISAGLFFFLCSFPVRAETDLDEIDITELSIEELMDIEITSVSKKPQKMNAAAAAIFVITQDDIRRSGVTSIPEALRMAPGVEVARIDSNKWAITSRGFNGRFANKLLVLIDGRSVYTPLFSGVFWDVQDLLLEDVERIEVIRGPGSALWGANAVNGVINIITKEAGDTQGGLVTAGYGTEEQGFGSLRYGVQLGEDSHARVYATYRNRDDAVFTSGEDATDDWEITRGGFRFDAAVSGTDTVTVQGDLYDGEAGQTVTVPALLSPFSETREADTDMTGGNVLVRWKHVFSPTSELGLHLYYDRTERDDPVFSEDRDTVDVDFQHRFALGERQEFVWGLGYRFTSDTIDGSLTLDFDPDSRDDHLFSAFIQDDISLVRKRLRFIIGSKFEHNDYTGFEVQPTARLLWTPSARHTAWAAFSRSVRTPSRAEDDVRIVQQVLPTGIPATPLAFVTVVGDGDFESEELYAFEMGYRVLATDQLFLDVAAFFNIYDKLSTLEDPGTSFVESSPAPPHLVFPFVVDNKMDGEAYGAEVAADWRPLDWWRFQLSYSYLQIQLSVDGDSTDLISEKEEGESPHHQLSLRSSTDFGKAVEFDLWLRYVDELSSRNIDGYVNLDARLSWKPYRNLELSIVGQNLVEDQHLEFGTPLFINIAPTEVERSVYGKLAWTF